MATERASELASIVATYLRRHGFSKTLSAFSRENGEIPEVKDLIDLETLYELYASTKVNVDTKTKKSKKTLPEDMPKSAQGKEDVRDIAEEKVNEGASSERKKKKKGEKDNGINSPISTEGAKKKRKEEKPEETNDVRDIAEEKVNEGALPERKKEKKREKENFVNSPIPKEEGSTKKRKEEKPEEANETIEGLKLKEEKCLPISGAVKPCVQEALSNGHAMCDNTSEKIVVETHVENGGGLTTQQEVTHPEKTLKKKSKKEKKDQLGEQLPGSETPLPKEISQEEGLSKKKGKKFKDAGGPDDTCGEGAKDAVTTESAVLAVKFDAMKQPIESSDEPGGCGTSSRKKKGRKELSLEDAGDVNDTMQEPSEAKVEATKSEEETFDGKKQSGKKRKLKEDTSLVNGISNQDHNHLMASQEKTKFAGACEGAHDCNVEKYESGSAKRRKHKETSNDKKIPSGALAFQKIDVEKVTFSDPRLSDNSYWAKDGAEEGYGAKAQEVLGLVRGKDFRHEKTKKKRGSYRGGLIGLESHSIKFESSDED